MWNHFFHTVQIVQIPSKTVDHDCREENRTKNLFTPFFGHAYFRFYSNMIGGEAPSCNNNTLEGVREALVRGFSQVCWSRSSGIEINVGEDDAVWANVEAVLYCPI